MYIYQHIFKCTYTNIKDQKSQKRGHYDTTKWNNNNKKIQLTHAKEMELYELSDKEFRIITFWKLENCEETRKTTKQN